MIKNISYELIFKLLQTEELIAECAELYSMHYGKWSQDIPQKAGLNIKLSANKIKDWLDHPKSSIYVARLENRIIGYAIAIRILVPYYGIFSWVTQLVVHKDYRNEDVAKNILYSIWGASEDYAWGIISANPYAIRALEKATRRRSDPKLIKKKIEKIISIGGDNIPYMEKTIEYIVNSKTSKVNTNFFVDHSSLPNMIKMVISDDAPWILGEIEEGWEWLAFTFKDQDQIKLTSQEIENMIQTSDMVTKSAYERMNNSEKQKWMQNAKYEVDFIIQECNLKKKDLLIDFGCGTGRHALELAQNDIRVQAVDYIAKNIDVAKELASERGFSNIEFLIGDCRDIVLSKAKALICLYDVIGSFVNDDENLKILKNIANHLDTGGIALISVMNYELSNKIAKYRFQFNNDPNKLLELTASQTMEKTGNIFNPDYYMVDTDTKVIYRKERFELGNSLPIELIVRDRRYTKSEFEKMCNEVGLNVVFSRYVNARDWRTGFEATDDSAKEILIKCVKA